MNEEVVIVAIDGPSGVGKSTTSRRAAVELKIPHIDTGAMYRAVALESIRQETDLDDESAVAKIAEEIDIEFRHVGSTPHVYLNGEDVSASIRTSEVGMAASKVSAFSPVRRRLVELQRQIGHSRGGVLEGRDIGTKVFPETPHKFFLTARPEVRADRRWKELREKGVEESYESVLADLQKRDHQDSTRADSPLTWDETYTVIDTSSLTIDQVVERIVTSVLQA
ncbi:MAG: (d)CMP kinase [Thermoanaerobaculia bacterium]|nr:(d)CMP kinase [Thermoanaerobaculia bacterium]